MRKLMVCLVALVATAMSANAAPIIAASSGLPSPDHTINFNEVAVTTGAAVTTQFQPFGATFSNWTYNNPNGGSIPGPIIAHFGFGAGSTGFIFFNDPVSDAAFRFQTNFGTSTFAAYLDGVLVESFSTPTTFPSSTDWFGFTGIVFDEIRIQPGSNGDAVLGQLQFNDAVVPEPVSILVFGGLLVGGGLVARKRLMKKVVA